LTDPIHSPGPSAVAPEPVTVLPGVGASLAGKLARLGVHRVGDLLFLLPTRYENRTRLAEIGTLRPGMRVTVEGHVDLTEVVIRRRRMMLCRISDGSGGLLLRFFHFTRSQSDGLKRGTRIRCFGEVRQGPAGLEIVHPEYRRLAEQEEAPLEDSYTPVYPSTEGLGQGRIRRLVGLALQRLAADPPVDLLPPQITESLGFPPLVEALLYLHRPPVGASLALLEAGRHPAQQRLAFEELLAQHLSLRMLRRKIRDRASPRLASDGQLLERFLQGLPFRLTGAQERVLGELLADMASDRPMLRLVQGDVGSGKTVVAAAAAVVAASAGYQAAVMAPTELLAEQHYRNFEAWLAPLELRVAWLAGRLGAPARRRALEEIGSGRARVAVGTHALFQEGVEFSRLGLVIIDEQHRFGVHQRLALTEKGEAEGLRPHQLVMTATPIPRTLAMTSYADLDTSSIDELPPGRGQVSTVAVPASRRPEVLDRVRLACEAGRQAYWVCPLIEESEALQYQAAEETAATLAEALPNVEIGLVHGRMKAAEKQAVMDDFKSGRVQLLVATTVIEVGVDVPNASLMIIENSERMGLAQLHQLRGRVGRGSAESSCVLMYQPPLGETAERRLRVLRQTTDGFRIAEEDLRLRGPGEVLGTRQTGAMQMRVADIMRDRDLLPRVREVADRLLSSHSAVIPPLLDRWVGEAARYGQV